MKIHKYLGAIALTVAAVAFGTVGCDSTGPGHSAQFTEGAKKVAITGTVVFREANAGFYGILADNGGQYEPVNLDPKFRTDGERISFTGTLDTAMLGVHHWGNPIELASVSVIK